MKKTILEFKNVGRMYGDKENVTVALEDISFKIDEGEFVAVTGPSGSGKSTILHLMGLLDRPSTGSIMVNGEDIKALNDKKLAKLRSQTIGFVFQQFNLLAKTAALYNVELPLVYQGVGGKKRLEMAREQLEKVGLGDRLLNRPSQLSGGQQQRVAIARALVTRPKLLLADEPTGNLDSKTGEEILRLFSQLHQSGNTIVLVTHDPGVAKRAQRQIVVKDGRLVK